MMRVEESTRPLVNAFWHSTKQCPCSHFLLNLVAFGADSQHSVFRLCQARRGRHNPQEGVKRISRSCPELKGPVQDWLRKARVFRRLRRLNAA